MFSFILDGKHYVCRKSHKTYVLGVLRYWNCPDYVPDDPVQFKLDGHAYVFDRYYMDVLHGELSQLTECVCDTFNVDFNGTTYTYDDNQTAIIHNELDHWAHAEPGDQNRIAVQCGRRTYQVCAAHVIDIALRLSGHAQFFQTSV